MTEITPGLEPEEVLPFMIMDKAGNPSYIYNVKTDHRIYRPTYLKDQFDQDVYEGHIMVLDSHGKDKKWGIHYQDGEFFLFLISDPEVYMKAHYSEYGRIIGHVEIEEEN